MLTRWICLECLTIQLALRAKCGDERYGLFLSFAIEISADHHGNSYNNIKFDS